jgi:RNA polymerase sigma factor (sigma-70 family)
LCEAVVADESLQLVCRYLRRFGAPRQEAEDGPALRRYVEGRDPEAFALLVRRHGPMVLGVCRRVLGAAADVEDAFQATFLSLARRAGAVRDAGRLGAWLHRVALRTARKARARRRAPAGEAAEPMVSADPADAVAWGEVRQGLDEELDRLPERLRAPLVLCYLDGLTRDEAARRLGWSLGTLKRRLGRGRELLRKALTARGLAPAGLAAAVTAGGLRAAVPGRLLRSTCRAGACPDGRAFSEAVLSLTGGGGRTMGGFACKVLLIVLTVAGGLATGLLPLTGSAGPAGPPALPGAGRAGEKPRSRTDRFGDALPAGAVARMGTVRFRHDHPYLFLLPKFSPDGKVLVTGGNNEMRLWDFATGKLLREIRDDYGYSEPVFARDGQWLAGRTRKSVRLWDPATGRRLRDLPGEIRALASSPDGKVLATVAQDGSISLWEAVTGKRVAQMRGGHKGKPFTGTFTADGKGLVTLGTKYRVCHWDVRTGELRKAVPLTIPHRHALCFSPDGQTLAVSARGDQPVVLLDTATGKERVKLQGEMARAGIGLAFSPDGKTLATSSVDMTSWKEGATVALWDVRTGKPLRHFSVPSRAARLLRFSPDGRTLLTAGYGPLVHLWDSRTGKRLHNQEAHETDIRSVAFTPDGHLVSGAGDGTVRLWEVATGRHVRKLAGHHWGVNAVAVTPDGKAILSGGTDGCIRVQGLDGKQIRRLLLGRDPEGLDEPDHQVLALRVAADGKTAVTYSMAARPAGGFYHVWDLLKGKALTERRDPSGSIGHRVFSPDGRRVAEYVMEGSGGGGPDAGGGLAGGEGATGSAPAPARTQAILRDVATGKYLLALNLPDLPGHIEGFSPDGRTLMTVTLRDERREDGWHYHNALRLWELASGKERLTIKCSAAGRFLHVVFAPDGRRVATARSDGVIQVWDVVTGRELLSRSGFLAECRCLAFAPDGRYLASGHADGTILVWDVSSPGKVGPARAADAADLARWKKDLFGDDARKAHAAVWGLAGVPGEAVKWLRGRVRPAPRPEAPKKVRGLIADLDSGDFHKREAAGKELAALGGRAEPALQAALEKGPSAEQRRRIREVLAVIARAQRTEVARQVRAVEVLERIGDEDARKVLEALSEGAPGARLTKEAKEALKRIGLSTSPASGPGSRS